MYYNYPNSIYIFQKTPLDGIYRTGVAKCWPQIGMTSLYPIWVNSRSNVVHLQNLNKTWYFKKNVKDFKKFFTAKDANGKNSLG